MKKTAAFILIIPLLLAFSPDALADDVRIYVQYGFVAGGVSFFIAWGFGWGDRAAREEKFRIAAAGESGDTRDIRDNGLQALALHFRTALPYEADPGMITLLRW